MDKKTISNWREIEFSSNRNTSYTVQSTDKNTRLLAGLKKNFAISRTDNFTEFDGTVSAGVVNLIVEQNSGEVSAPINPPPVSGKQYTYSYWNDNFSYNNPRIISPSDNENYTAVYKYVNHANC